MVVFVHLDDLLIDKRHRLGVGFSCLLQYSFRFMGNREGVDEKPVRFSQAFRRVRDYPLFDELSVLGADLIQPVEVVLGRYLLKIASRDLLILKA